MKVWSGRFAESTDALMDEFNNSLPVDQQMLDQDIAGSIAWARALVGVSVLTKDEADSIEHGLRTVCDRIKDGTVQFLPTDEDIHTAVERMLTELIGPTGAKLHTGRSRNDQVVTDFRLYAIEHLRALIPVIRELQKTILDRARIHTEIIIPGYTHLQQAQPILLAHYWLSFFYSLNREVVRLQNAVNSADLMPLGSGAIAGSGFAVDRKALASQLGFSDISKNSIDGVASRDFVLEALASCVSCGVVYSRYAEDLIIWSSREFGFVELDDAWSTGSSMMPQKKNPDSLELIRGKTGRLIGNYTRAATTFKGVGLTYYKDLQEDKEPLFDSLRQVDMITRVFTGVIGTLRINTARVAADLDPLLLATDIADYLVRKGMPFREAHGVIGRLVRHSIAAAIAFDKIPLSVYKEHSGLFEQDLFALFDWKAAINSRSVAGGTSEKNVAESIATAEKLLQ